MQRFEHFLGWSRGLASFIAIFLAELIIEKLQDAKIPFVGAFLLAVIIGIVAMQLFEFAVTALFDRAKWIRRVVFGDDYIEGMWCKVPHFYSGFFSDAFTGSSEVPSVCFQGYGQGFSREVRRPRGAPI